MKMIIQRDCHHADSVTVTLISLTRLIARKGDTQQFEVTVTPIEYASESDFDVTVT